MATIYDSRSVNKVVINSPPYTLILPSNPRRVSLIVSSDGSVAANGAWDIFTDNPVGSGVVRLIPGTQLTMAYRDFGPIIQREIWAAVLVGTMNMVATEVVIVGQ